MSLLRRTLALLALAVATVGFAAAGGSIGVERATATALVGDCVVGSGWGTPRADLASQAVQLVNAHRTAMGLRALVVSPTLSASAVWKAQHMARYAYMAHDDPAPPVSRTAGQRILACGYSASWGENIAYGYASAQAVVDAWLASSGHRANIENASYAAIGSGAAVGSSGYVYWAQDFGTMSDGGAPPPRRRRLRHLRRHLRRRRHHLRRRLRRHPRRRLLLLLRGLPPRSLQPRRPRPRRLRARAATPPRRRRPPEPPSSCMA